MATPPVNPSREPDPLPREASSLRRLARRLLFDPAGADDLVQEAWLASLRRGERTQTPGWLHGAVRLLARQKRREEERRRRREERVARERGLAPPADELSARLETTRRVVEAVEHLADPYRALIVMRFFDDLPPREIARRRDVPVRTVQTQIQRGLALLRKQLAREESGSSDFLAALLPLAGPVSPLALLLATGSSPLSKWSGSLLMSIKTKTLCALGLTLALVGGATSWLNAGLEAGGPREAAPLLLSEPARAELSQVAVPEAPSKEREVPSSVGDEERTELTPWILSGVVRARDVGLEDCSIRLRLFEGFSQEGESWQDVRTRTDAEGRFRYAFSEPEHSLFVQVSASRVGYLSSSHETIIVRGDPAPSVGLRLLTLDAWIVGRVVDELGEPLSGASIESWFEDARTDSEGRFRLACSTDRSEVRAQVVADGYRTERLSAFVRAVGEVPIPDLVLRPEAPVHGRVVDEQGAPISDAEVRTSLADPPVARTDEQGRFRAGGLAPDGSWLRLHVRAPGWARVEQRLSAEELAASRSAAWSWTRPVRRSRAPRSASTTHPACCRIGSRTARPTAPSCSRTSPPGRTRCMHRAQATPSRSRPSRPPGTASCASSSRAAVRSMVTSSASREKPSRTSGSSPSAGASRTIWSAGRSAATSAAPSASTTCPRATSS